MNTKTQELVTAGYKLAKGLDVESATLVKQLADELAVQRVRADELNKQVVNLTVENAGAKAARDIIRHLNANREEARFCGIDDDYIDAAVEAMITPATDAAIANIQAQGVEKYADNLDSSADAAERDGFDDAVKFLRSEASGVRLLAAEIRKGVLYEQ
jgi:hypothetical protein